MRELLVVDSVFQVFSKVKPNKITVEIERVFGKIDLTRKHLLEFVYKKR